MTKDIGVVLLPNQACKKFVSQMTEETARQLKEFKQLPSTPHVTLFHIANVDDNNIANVINIFHEIYNHIADIDIDLMVKKISATGGSDTEGYKWLDLQFKNSPELDALQQQIVQKFCPFHQGVLTRMYDDMAKYNDSQKAEIAKCGVTYSNYIPHITSWYIDLPYEAKTTKLANIANSLEYQEDYPYKAEAIALVELGRNGNAISIIEQHNLLGQNHHYHNEL